MSTNQNNNTAGNLGKAEKDATRFYSKVTIVNGVECWPFTGYINPKGYGQFKLAGRTRMAHQVAYELAYGPVPPGLEVDHTCNNPACVRFEHLEAVTHEENMRRGAERRTHCRNGHEWTPENTRNHKGRRHCRACARANSKRYYDKNRAKKAAEDSAQSEPEMPPIRRAAEDCSGDPPTSGQ